MSLRKLVNSSLPAIIDRPSLQLNFHACERLWLLICSKIQQMTFIYQTMSFRFLANDFYMFSKWFSLSANDFYMFNERFLYSANDFYIQQEIYIFSNMKFVFSNMRSIFNNLRFALNEIKFMKLKPFAFSKPNLDVTKYTIKSIRQNERSGL